MLLSLGRPLHSSGGGKCPTAASSGYLVFVGPTGYFGGSSFSRSARAARIPFEERV